MEGRLISRGLEVLEQHGWTQGHYGNERDGFCMVGALYRALREEGLTDEFFPWQGPLAQTLRHLRAQTGIANIAMWNDEEGRTFSQVREVMRRAAAEAGAELVTA